MATRGRPFEPGNQFGRGRPRGSKNKVREEARTVLAEYAAPLIRKGIADALQEGGPILRALLAHVLGPPKANPVAIGAIRTKTAADVSKSSQMVVYKVGRGDITLADGHALADLLATRLDSIKAEEMEKRLEDLELESKK